jgi:hypothetical protein
MTNYSNEAQETFTTLSKELIKWLNTHTNPHTKIIIDTTSAQIVAAELGLYTEEFILD